MQFKDLAIMEYGHSTVPYKYFKFILQINILL